MDYYSQLINRNYSISIHKQQSISIMNSYNRTDFLIIDYPIILAVKCKFVSQYLKYCKYNAYTQF